MPNANRKKVGVTKQPDMTIEECAIEKNVSERTIRRYIAKGLLPATRVGPTLIRVNPDDLVALGRPIPTA